MRHRRLTRQQRIQVRAELTSRVLRDYHEAFEAATAGMSEAEKVAFEHKSVKQAVRMYTLGELQNP
jgi:hypothetical protein